MTKHERERQERLLPNGEPRWVRIYDCGRDEAIDHITVIYTGNHPHRNGYIYITGMNESPYSPLGFCQHMQYRNGEIVEGSKRGAWTPKMGKSGNLGKRIPFSALNRDCQRVILQDYSELWNLDIDIPKPSISIESD